MLKTYPQGAQAQSSGTAQIASVLSPVGGWNTRDSLGAMDATDAVVLDNWICDVGLVRAREGYSDFVTDIAGDIGGAWAGDDVETLIPFKFSSSEHFLACMDGGVARIDTGTATQVKVRGTYTSDRWQWTVFTDSAAPNTPKVVAVNGADTPWTYDGTTHAAWAPTGITPASAVWIMAFKNRLYAGHVNSRNFWYGALGAIAGTFTEFPLSGIRGAQGNILFAAAMTRDTGSGPDDYAVFVTTEGQVIVYQGDDPGDATRWSLVGVYQIPRPIQSRRAYAQLFGDVMIATELDYIWLASTLQTSGAVLVTPSKFTGAMRDAAARYKENYGWEIMVSGRDGLVLSNIPLQTNGQYEQHCFNLQTKAGSRFTGWPFRTFAVWNGSLYGATSNAVFRLFNGGADDADGAADRIELRAQTAWTNFQTPKFKHVRAIRPLLRATGTLNIAAALGVDFRDPSIVAAVSNGPPGATTLWGDTSGVTTLWGDTAATTTYWSGTASPNIAAARQWRLNAGRGSDFCLSLAADVQDQQIEWLSTDYKVTPAERY